MTSKETGPVGVVGVGRMGLAIIRHLSRHGYATVAYDVSAKQCDAAREFKAQIASNPADVGKAAKIVIIAVGYDDEATAVMSGKDGLLETMGAGSTIIVSSTCSPEHVRGLAEKAAAKSVDLVDAPICRGAQAADAGTMLALVGASEKAFAVAEPVLRTFCADVARLGDVGAGQFGKSMNNYLLWVNGIALIEAGRLSEANGMDLVKLREALLMSSGASDALKNWENVSFIWALKDMQIVLKIADSAGMSLPIAGSIKELVKDGLRTKRSNPPDWTGRNRSGSH
jgi:3-hydroxyisobutyrate dehydrogenase-like beta-hydroxyacid dehydrogenase